MSQLKYPFIIMLVVAVGYYLFAWLILYVGTLGNIISGDSLSISLLFEQERLRILLLYTPIYLLIIRFAYRKTSGNPFREFVRAMFPKSAWKRNEPIYGLRIGAAITLIWILISTTFGGLTFTPGAFGLLWITGVIGTALWVITEGICFNGLFFELTSNQNLAHRVLITSILFTISRILFFSFSIAGTVGTLLLGLTLGYLRVRWNNLWVPTLLHFLLIAALSWFFGLPIGGEPVYSILTPYSLPIVWGGWYGPLASPICWILLLSIPLMLEAPRYIRSPTILWITNLLGGNSPNKI